MSTGNPRLLDDDDDLKDPRDRIPEYPTHDLPQTGWHVVDAYAAAMGQTRRNFQDNLRRYNVPFLQCGAVRIVHAETLFAALKCNTDDDTEEDSQNGKKARKR